MPQNCPRSLGIPVHSGPSSSAGTCRRFALKIPSIRQTQSETASPDIKPTVPPLEISVTHTIDDRAKTYELQEIAYGLRKDGKNALYTVIWIWLGALLSFGALFYEDIKEHGLQAVMSGSMFLAISPALILLVVLTIVGFLWSWTGSRRRLASYRTHMHALGEGEPRTVTIRFDGEGITVTEPDGATQLQPWHDNVSMMEDEQRICFVTQMQEMSIVAPKQSLSPEEIDAVRAWNTRRTAGGAPTTPTVQQELVGNEIIRSGEFSSERHDLMATLQEIANAPTWRAKRLRTYVLFTVAFGMLTPTVFLIGWIMDPDRLPLSISWPLYLEMFSTLFWKPALVGLGLVLLLALLQPIIRRWSAGYYADQILKNGFSKGIVVIGEHGVWDGGTTLRLFLPWQAMRKVRITPAHIILTIRLGAIVTYPKRAFPPEAIERIDTLFRERAGKTEAFAGRNT